MLFLHIILHQKIIPWDFYRIDKLTLNIFRQGKVHFFEYAHRIVLKLKTQHINN